MGLGSWNGQLGNDEISLWFSSITSLNDLKSGQHSFCCKCSSFSVENSQKKNKGELYFWNCVVHSCLPSKIRILVTSSLKFLSSSTVHSPQIWKAQTIHQWSSVSKYRGFLSWSQHKIFLTHSLVSETKQKQVILCKNSRENKQKINWGSVLASQQCANFTFSFLLLQFHNEIRWEIN